VSDRLLIARTGLEALIAPGRHGAPVDAPGVTIELRADYALADVAARRGRSDALSDRVRAAFGLDLPLGPRRAAKGPIAFASAGPAQWLAIARDVEPRSFEAWLASELEGVAFITDCSDDRVVLAVGGPKARSVLAKGVPVDLHPRAFGRNGSAVTVAHHIAVHLWQVDDAPTFELAVHRSDAASFWHWLIEAGCEFGVMVT
jgi:methylglutamate dehydrogenase subunit D